MSLISGIALFGDGAVNCSSCPALISGPSCFVGSSINCGSLSSACFLSPTAVNCGDAVYSEFRSGSKNCSTADTAFFFDDSSNFGTILQATFSGSSINSGIVENVAAFVGSSINLGTINDVATFAESSSNNGIVQGNVTFSDTSFNLGTINGDVIFTGSSCNAGTIQGDVCFSENTRNEGCVYGAVTSTSGAVICTSLYCQTLFAYDPNISGDTYLNDIVFGAFDLVSDGAGSYFTGSLRYLNSGIMLYDDTLLCSYVSDGCGDYIKYFRTGICIGNAICNQDINGELYPCGYVNLYSNGLGGCYCLTNLPVITQQPVSVLPEIGCSFIEVVEFQEFAINLSASGDNLNYKWYNNNDEEIIDNTNGWTGANTSYLYQFCAQADGWFDCYYGLVYNEAGAIRSCSFPVTSTAGVVNGTFDGHEGGCWFNIANWSSCPYIPDGVATLDAPAYIAAGQGSFITPCLIYSSGLENTLCIFDFCPDGVSLNIATSGVVCISNSIIL